MDMALSSTSGVDGIVSTLEVSSFVPPPSPLGRQAGTLMSITDYGSGEMGGPKFIATCGDQRMSISMFKGMTVVRGAERVRTMGRLSLIHISEPTRLGMISYAVFCL